MFLLTKGVNRYLKKKNNFQKQNISSIAQSDEFNQHDQNVIFTIGGELKSHLNGTSWHNCGQYSSAEIQNASINRPLSSPIPSPSLSSSEPQQPPLRSTGDCCCSSMNQSEDKHTGAKDYSGKEQRKLTR